MSDAHTCHAIDCGKRVPPAMFMCKRHWYMVPKPLRDQIWRHYRPGQENDWAITQAYAETAKRALIAVAEKEGRTVTGAEDELTLYDYFAPEGQTP